MTKKCLISFITYILFSAICLTSMHLMLLVDVNKYVGVGVGAGILIVAFALYIIFHKKRNFRSWVPLFPCASAIGCGLAISSLYVYLGTSPTILYSFCIWGAYVILFLSYCLLVNIPFFKRFPRICLTIYGLLILVGGIVGIILSSKIVFSLALMLFILFIFHLATILVHSRNYSEHFNVLALVSFGELFIVVIVVLIILSEGDGLDSIDFQSGGGAAYRDSKGNPYDFTYNV